MSTLADRMRQQRQVRIAVDKYTFIALRPTPLQMDAARETLQSGTAEERAKALYPFIVGWDGVTELDLLNGGAAHPVPFDHAACAEWLSNRADLLGPVLNGIVQAFVDHAAAVEAATKN